MIFDKPATGTSKATVKSASTKTAVKSTATVQNSTSGKYTPKGSSGNNSSSALTTVKARYERCPFIGSTTRPPYWLSGW